MGDPPNHKPDENTVRMALPGLIYHKWDPPRAGDGAAVELVLKKLRTVYVGDRAGMSFVPREDERGRDDENDLGTPETSSGASPGGDARSHDDMQAVQERLRALDSTAAKPNASWAKQSWMRVRPTPW